MLTFKDIPLNVANMAAWSSGKHYTELSRLFNYACHHSSQFSWCDLPRCDLADLSLMAASLTGERMLEIDIVTFESVEAAPAAIEVIGAAAKSAPTATAVSAAAMAADSRMLVAAAEPVSRSRIDYRESFLFGWRF
jgi:hypothetical protein